MRRQEKEEKKFVILPNEIIAVVIQLVRTWHSELVCEWNKKQDQCMQHNKSQLHADDVIQHLHVRPYDFA